MALTDLSHPEAERAVLAAVLVDGGLLKSGQLDTLAPDDFYAERHRVIFTAMGRVSARQQPVDLRTLQAELEQRGELDAVGGLAYLVQLDEDLSDLSHVEAYATVVRAAATRRRLLDSLRNSIRLLEAGKPIEEAISEANGAIRTADERTATERLIPIGECLGDVRAAMDKPSPTGLIGLPSGYLELDRITLGFQPGQLIVISGRPGQGKTALACCMAMSAAEFGAPAAIFSLEMGRQELAARLICAETGLGFAAVRSGHMSNGQRALVDRAMGTLAELPLLLIDSPHLTPSRLAALIRRARREADVRLVVVDYLGLLGSDEKHETRNLEVAALSRSLKILAKDAGLPIIALHQLNRAPEKRQSPRPQLSDLRDSGAIEQDADTVIMIYQDPNAEGGEAELIVAKQRNGMTGTVKVKAVLQAFRFDPIKSPPAQAGIHYGDF